LWISRTAESLWSAGHSRVTVNPELQGGLVDDQERDGKVADVMRGKARFCKVQGSGSRMRLPRSYSRGRKNDRGYAVASAALHSLNIHRNVELWKILDGELPAQSVHSIHG
jgi:hypothetical protein